MKILLNYEDLGLSTEDKEIVSMFQDFLSSYKKERQDDKLRCTLTDWIKFSPTVKARGYYTKYRKNYLYCMEHYPKLFESFYSLRGRYFYDG